MGGPGSRPPEAPRCSVDFARKRSEEAFADAAAVIFASRFSARSVSC